MKVEKARYVYNENYPLLEMTIDGKSALVGEMKKFFLDLGYVRLGSREVMWEKVLPVLKTPKDCEIGEVELEGFTDDPVVVQLARDFWDATNGLNGKTFEEGEIGIPEVQ